MPYSNPVYSPGQIVTAIRTLFGGSVGAIQSTLITYEWFFDTFEGFRMLDFNVLNSGIVVNGGSWILMTLPADELAPLEFFTDSQGWDGCSLARWSSDAGPTTTWPICHSNWYDAIPAVKADIIGEWSLGVVSASDSSNVQSAGGAVGTACAVQVFMSDSRYYVSVEQLSASDSATPDGVAPPYPIPTGSPSASPIVSVDTSAIVAAIESLASVDTTVSINQGAFVYSIKNREVSTP